MNWRMGPRQVGPCRECYLGEAAADGWTKVHESVIGARAVQADNPDTWNTMSVTDVTTHARCRY